ncbi:GH23975 [Drosophila grimshawi]|uniref:GH23975 n=1 Tax=Drosophila grimshawi TaxID=7222 RepID=B4JZP4_DROGR|nr:GH23975 [Drosophila grimshawi]
MEKEKNALQLTIIDYQNVSTVLLYGIPIVSLYIEGQERLCLAQISNTLLKQFSYNEIHNRRVALGITCVQCTPVQLEILRRAGAMPVSSRRCGMITRREAERLCKSFLGDNTPPRLPDDFAFNVQHKCAWGCRGSFLPSRYNSSRAKCIKCSYCGMFFSPNKFIFHSHRITTNDRYIQPDAANFNSWRRHMTLSGHGQDEEITHAWEDVKAMFNGGTRKRLVSCNGNNNGNNRNRSTTSSTSLATLSKTSAVIDNTCDSPLINCESQTKAISPPCLKRTALDHPYNYSTVTAAAAVVGVTAVAATVGVPFNLHRSAVISPLQSLRNEHDLSIMPLSRNFVVDYTMWQQQNNQHTKKLNANETINSFETCPTPWGRPEITVSATAAGENSIRLIEHNPFNIIKNEPNSASICGVPKSRKLPDGDRTDFNMPSLLNSSAFKPVVASAAIVSTSLYATRSNYSNNNIYISPAQPTRTTTVFTHNSITTAESHGAIFNSASSAFPPILDSIQLCTENEESESTPADANNPQSVNLVIADNSDKSPSSDQIYINSNICRNTDEDDQDNDDDDEVVDIETTEDDVQTMNASLNMCPPHSPTDGDLSSRSASHSHSASPNDDVDVDGFTTDTEDQFDVKSNICSYDINITRSNFKIYNNEKEKISTTEEELLQNYKKKNCAVRNGAK